MKIEWVYDAYLTLSLINVSFISWVHIFFSWTRIVFSENDSYFVGTPFQCIFVATSFVSSPRSKKYISGHMSYSSHCKKYWVAINIVKLVRSTLDSLDIVAYINDVTYC